MGVTKADLKAIAIHVTVSYRTITKLLPVSQGSGEFP